MSVTASRTSVHSMTVEALFCLLFIFKCHPLLLRFLSLLCRYIYRLVIIAVGFTGVACSVGHAYFDMSELNRNSKNGA